MADLQPAMQGSSQSPLIKCLSVMQKRYGARRSLGRRGPIVQVLAKPHQSHTARAPPQGSTTGLQVADSSPPRMQCSMGNPSTHVPKRWFHCESSNKGGFHDGWQGVEHNTGSDHIKHLINGRCDAERIGWELQSGVGSVKGTPWPL
ncbi:unnamed protein product [Arctogadus glacialis]